MDRGIIGLFYLGVKRKGRNSEDEKLRRGKGVRG
jgi:hypothetical protein